MSTQFEDNNPRGTDVLTYPPPLLNSYKWAIIALCGSLIDRFCFGY